MGNQYRRIIDIHPDDTTARHGTMRHLFTIRELTSDRPTVAHALGIGVQAVWGFENEPAPNPKVDVAQRYARATGHRIILTPTGMLDPDPDDVTIAFLARLTDKGDPARADELHRLRVMAHLVSVRKWHGVTHARLAEIVGCSESAVCQIEQERHTPWLSTYQRHARAIAMAAGWPGGLLRLHIEPVTVQTAIAA